MKCAFCGIDFIAKKKTSKYCSIPCQRNAMRAKRKRPLIATCMYCGEVFPVERDRKGMFCSVMCQARYYGEERTRDTQERREEQKRIALEEKKRKLEEAKAEYEKAREEYEKAHTKECIVCGVVFRARNTRQLCCSPKCSKCHDNVKKSKRLYRNGVPDLSISLTKLYMRDMGVCQICGEHIDFDCDSNSDEYPSIDHIKPLAKGGLHEWNNVQLACRGCNSKKSDRY